MPQPSFVQSLIARAILSSRLVDRGYRFFDRLRSRVVLEWAPDTFYDVYNDLMYARDETYRAGSEVFRSSLFPFEERALSSHFPPPPGTVLVGAAGGGREALEFARRGYDVVAFEPVRRLAASLADVRGELSVESFVGRYEGLPVVHSLSDPSITIDLRLRAPFAAAILGWGSISHLHSDEHCIATLRVFGQLTRGPILVSYFPNFGGPKRRFHVSMGYFRQFTGADIRALAEDAELEVVYLDDEGMTHWHAILRTPTLAAERAQPSGPT